MNAMPRVPGLDINGLGIVAIQKVGADPDADMACLTSVAAAAPAASVRFFWTFWIFRRAEAWASVRFGAPAQPIGCDSLPSRIVVEAQAAGRLGEPATNWAWRCSACPA